MIYLSDEFRLFDYFSFLHSRDVCNLFAYIINVNTYFANENQVTNA